MSRTLKLAVIPGDGIGPEVIAEAVKVLDVVAPQADLVVEKTQFSLGADRYLETGDVLSEDDLAAIRRVGRRGVDRRRIGEPLQRSPALVRLAVTGVAATPVAHDPVAAKPAHRNVQASACAARPCWAMG